MYFTDFGRVHEQTNLLSCVGIVKIHVILVKTKADDVVMSIWSSFRMFENVQVIKVHMVD